MREKLYDITKSYNIEMTFENIKKILLFLDNSLKNKKGANNTFELKFINGDKIKFGSIDEIIEEIEKNNLIDISEIGLTLGAFDNRGYMGVTFYVNSSYYHDKNLYLNLRDLTEETKFFYERLMLKIKNDFHSDILKSAEKSDFKISKEKIDIIKKTKLCPFSDTKECNLEKTRRKKPFCFIALPTSLRNGSAMEYIEETLTEMNVDICKAVDNVSPAKEMWCDKICSKILESDFCIVFLNEEKRKANPNVYYEYGFMSGINKKIIPIQNTKHKLQFDVSNRDTIKYSKKEELKKKLKKAIEHILKN